MENLHAFGIGVTLISVIGDDEASHNIEKELDRLGVVYDGLIKSDDRCTTIKSRVMVGSYQLVRYDKEVTKYIRSEEEKSILHWINMHIEEFSIVLISDYNKGVLTPTFLKKLFTLCRKKKY